MKGCALLRDARLLEGSYTDYLFLFGEYRTAYSDLCAKSAAGEKGKLYLMVDAREPYGYLCRMIDGNGEQISYLFIVPKHRRKGYGSQLLHRAVGEVTCDLWVHLLESTRDYEAVRSFFEKNGFCVQHRSITYRSGIEKDLSHWQCFMEEKGNRIRQLLLGMGFVPYSFREAPKELLNVLLHSAENAYRNPLDVKPFFEDCTRGLDLDMSFLIAYEGAEEKQLAAYCLVVRPDERTAVFEHISAAKAFQTTGCVFLPISCSMEVFRQMGCNRAAYTVYEDNRRANSFRNKMFERVTVSAQRTHHYLFRR